MSAVDGAGAEIVGHLRGKLGLLLGRRPDVVEDAKQCLDGQQHDDGGCDPEYRSSPTVSSYHERNDENHDQRCQAKDIHPRFAEQWCELPVDDIGN